MVCHGPLACRNCFRAVNGDVAEADGFQLENGPGWWGASDPVVLVLGQSKGRNQSKVETLGVFDEIAFAGLRVRLAAVLGAISIEMNYANLDKHFTATEDYFAFASILRCAISAANGKTSGSPLMGALRTSIAGAWLDTCLRTWMRYYNPRLRLVVALGLSRKYVNGVMQKLAALHGADFARVNEYVARVESVTWVFAQHPSPISQNHFRRWTSDEPHRARDLVRHAVADAGI